MPVIPNHEERRDNKMYKVNSIKCSREIKKTDTIFLRAYGIDEVIMDIQNSHLSRVVLTVFRLVMI